MIAKVVDMWWNSPTGYQKDHISADEGHLLVKTRKTKIYMSKPKWYHLELGVTLRVYNCTISERKWFK